MSELEKKQKDTVETERVEYVWFVCDTCGIKTYNDKYDFSGFPCMDRKNCDGKFEKVPLFDDPYELLL